MNKKLTISVLLLSILVTISSVYYILDRGDHRPLNEQLVSFLQDYLKIDTSQPKPSYTQAINFLKKHAQYDGFSYKTVELPSGNKVFIMSIKGTNPSLPALALNHHMDVVPATNEGWITPPFSGKIHEGHIIGRGTQDMKGIGATHYFALKELKEQGFIPQRSIHLFAVPDEEIGGFKGTKEFVKTDAFKQLNIGYIIDEGHASGKPKTLDFKVAERKPIQIKITSKGELAHGSHLACHNAIHRLIQFLQEIVAIHLEQKTHLKSKQPGELMSCNITSLTAGIKKENGTIALNIVPDLAQATIDIRVPPTVKKQEVLELLNNKIKEYPELNYDILAQADEEPSCKDYHSELYNALSKTVEKMGFSVQPHYFEASSDLRFYQALGIDGIGLTPFTIQDNIHGINESVPIEQLIEGKNIMVTFIKNFCG